MIHLPMHVGILPACCLVMAPVRNLEDDSEVHKDSANYQNSSFWGSSVHGYIFQKACAACCTIPFLSLSLWLVQMCWCGGLWLCPAGSLESGNLETSSEILGVTSYFILDAALESREKVFLP